MNNFFGTCEALDPDENLINYVGDINVYGL